MPELTGPSATLAEIVLGVAFVVAIAEALGTVGAFKLIPLTLAFGILGLVAMRVGRSGFDADDRPAASTATDAAPMPRTTGVPRSWGLAVIASIAVLTAEWMTRVVDSWNRGMLTIDTLWYHLPIAARFAQDGWTFRLVHVDARSLIEFYPSTAELLHAIGMVFLGNDTLSLILNLAFVALSLFAAWCIGQRFGVPHLTLVGAAMVLATPQLVLDDAGSGLTDVVGIAFFLAAIALVSNAMREEASPRERRAEMICGALAAGLAVGTKYTLVMPVAMLGVGVIALTPRGDRLRLGAKWFAVVSAAGGYWYIRNFAAVGSPVPSARLGIGPLHLPSIPFANTKTLAQFVLNAEAWSAYLLPGLRGAFGPAWWGLVAAAIAGIVAAALVSDRTTRVLGFVSFGCLVAYVFTPGVLGRRLPVFFEPNARYMAPFLILGALALPIALGRRSTRVRSALLLAYLLIIVGTQFGAEVWRHEKLQYAQMTKGSMPVIVGIAFGIAVAGIALAWHGAKLPRFHFHPPPTAPAVAVAAMLTVALVGAGLSAEQYALRHRYRHAQPMPNIYKWAQGKHDVRIAIVGAPLQYPLLGKDLSNRVQYLAKRRSNGKSTPIISCRTWRRALIKGRYQYVVTMTPSFPFVAVRPDIETAWTRSDPAAKLLLIDDHIYSRASLFEIRGRMNPNACT